MPINIHIPPEDLPSPERKAAIQERIDSVRHYARGLDAWERNFLNSIEEQLAARDFLTRGQRDKLNELYTEHVDPDEDDPL